MGIENGLSSSLNRNQLGFCVSTEIGKFFVRGSKLTLFCVRGKENVSSVSIEIDMLL